MTIAAEILISLLLVTGALFALVHDVTLTVGLFALTQMEFDLNIVAALLTLIGYSLNDTIVIYDRIPNGWNAIAKDSKDTNSIWVMKLSWKDR